MSSFNKDNYDLKISSNNDQDSTISYLKSRLFDLEQQEKDHNALKKKLSLLKNQLQSLTSNH